MLVQTRFYPTTDASRTIWLLDTLSFSWCQVWFATSTSYNAAMLRSAVGQLALPLLPDYCVRISRRAKRMQLHVSPEGRVEVVVPAHLSSHSVEDFVAENQQWLHGALDRIQNQRTGKEHKLPTSIRFAATGERWLVRYRHGSQAKYFERSASDLSLEVYSCTHCDSISALQQWLTHRARLTLIPMLQELAETHGFSFGKAIIRQQKTCWGSCSSRKTISLNRCLMFLPVKVVRYLLIHELCHTVHANHSKRYWKLVATIEPGYKRLDEKLRDAGQCLPNWVTA